MAYDEGCESGLITVELWTSNSRAIVRDTGSQHRPKVDGIDR